MNEIEKAYSPQKIDEKWYSFWEKNGFFSPQKTSDKPPFSVVMPPPNVTGILHMGHALGSTLTDIVVRWKRMLGHETFWIPGTDHAGIATQTVVEKHLIKTEGKRRADYSREEFLKHVWQWKESSEKEILNQLRKLGVSCDWSSLRFTMDAKSNRAVRTAFKNLFDKKLIYKGDYLVNWDPQTQTALSDDEVEYEEKSSFLWYFNYPVAGSSEMLTVATTRPETMLGDTAVAVSPSDPRYQHLIGGFVIHPINDQPMPIIADPYVDPEFGTGVVKITPAHDPNDYQIGLNHSLPMINIMTPDGKINENGGRFSGLTMEEGRDAVVRWLEKLALLVKIEPHVHRVGRSYRSKAIIEPYLSKQWFINMKHFKERLRECVQEEEVKIIPANWQNTYFHWIDNLRDWCISRQLWWGHRIPIWYHKADPNKMICYAEEGIPPEVRENPNDWEQDEDVLDTWFSSALWPFSTLGWPENTKALSHFFPNSVMITGHDILFFWVARMIMMSEALLETPPFHEVYLHSLIFGKSYWRETPDGIAYVSKEEQITYDLNSQTIPKDVHSKWEKMSKSKGNIIDPLEMIHQYGTDAVRMALAGSASQSWQIDLDRRRFEEFKNFANKIWNGARFILMNLSDFTFSDTSSEIVWDNLALEDQWILALLRRTTEKVNTHLANYAFDEATSAAYDFYWKEFCAYYLEICKPYLFGKIGTENDKKNKQRVLLNVLVHAIGLIHPIAPFITEELFQIIKGHLQPNELPKDFLSQHTFRMLSKASLMQAPFPEACSPYEYEEKVLQTFDLLAKLTFSIRQIRGEINIPPREPITLYISSKTDSQIQSIKENQHILCALISIEKIYFNTSPSHLTFYSKAVVEGIELILPMPESLIEQERARLAKEKNKLIVQVEQIEKKLNNPNFINHAPQELVNTQKALLAQCLNRIDEIQRLNF